jgi:hypothetical protein
MAKADDLPGEIGDLINIHLLDELLGLNVSVELLNERGKLIF